MKKPKWIKDIKVLVWDLDGTLYYEIPKMKDKIHKNVVKAIAQTKNLPFEKAKELYLRTFQKVQSSTKTMLDLSVNRDYVLSGAWYQKIQTKHMKKDERLVKMFRKLKKFRQIINTNSERKVTFKKLKILGLDLKIFEKIFTSDDFQERIKPNPFAFNLVLEYTKLKPSEHFFIGDSEGKEMIPAKKLGMRTCLVWGKSKIADISLKTVYDVEKLF